jgi:hypothetical protein
MFGYIYLILITLYINGMRQACINILPFIFGYLYNTQHVFNTCGLLEDGCSLQPKLVGAVKPVVQLVGNRLVCPVK